MAAALPIAMAVQAMGTLYSGISANNQAKAQAAAIDENGRRTLLQGELDSQEVRRQERDATGDMIASQGGSGLMLGSGSFADLITQNAYNRETDIFNIRSKASGDAAALYAQANQVRAKGRDALIGSMFSTVSGALSGASKMRSQNTLSDQAATERQAQFGPSSLGGATDIVLGPGVGVPRMRVMN